MGGRCFPVAMHADQAATTGTEAIWGAALVMATAFDAACQVWPITEQVKKFNLEEDDGAGRRVAFVEAFEGPCQKVENFRVPVVFVCPVQDQFAEKRGVVVAIIECA